MQYEATGLPAVQDSDALQILQDAETRLRQLMERAASHGNYAAVMDIAQAAGAIQKMLSGNGEGKPQLRANEILRLGKRRYPLFTRSGDDLVKTGYSSSAKKEYQHRTPREIVDSFVGMLDGFRKSAKPRFTMEDMLPFKVADRQVPDYQAYLILAWLRELRVVKRDGRVGYLVAAKKPLLSIVDAAWAELLSE